MAVLKFDPFCDAALKRANVGRHVANGPVALFESDIRDRTAMERVFGEVRRHVVLRPAAKAGVRPPLEDSVVCGGVNVMATANLLKLARSYEVERFIFGASSSAYGGNEKMPFSEDDAILQPAAPYGATKAAVDLFCESFAATYGRPVMAVRFSAVHGPTQRADLVVHKFAQLTEASCPWYIGSAQTEGFSPRPLPRVSLLQPRPDKVLEGACCV